MAWGMREKRKAKYVAGHEVTLLSNQSALPSKAISRPKLWFFFFLVDVTLIFCCIRHICHTKSLTTGLLALELFLFPLTHKK